MAKKSKVQSVVEFFKTAELGTAETVLDIVKTEIKVRKGIVATPKTRKPKTVVTAVVSAGEAA